MTIVEALDGVMTYNRNTSCNQCDLRDKKGQCLLQDLSIMDIGCMNGSITIASGNKVENVVLAVSTIYRAHV